MEGKAGDEEVTPWRFRLVQGTTAQPAQTLEVYDGSAWTSLGRLTMAIPLNTWVPIEVATSTTSATVTVNGQAFETDKRAAAADTLAGVTFTTSAPAAYGMTFFVDDLSVR